MKTAFFFLFLGLVAIAVLYAMAEVTLEPSTVQLRIRDNYIQIDYPVIVVLVLLFLSTLFSFGGLIRTKGKSRIFLLSFIICLSAALVLGVVVFQLFNS